MITTNKYEEDALPLLEELTTYGFKYSKDFEGNSPTSISFVYLKNNFALEFYFNVRDQLFLCLVSEVKIEQLSGRNNEGYNND